MLKVLAGAIAALLLASTVGSGSALAGENVQDDDVPDTFPAEARLAISLILSRTDD